MSHFKKPGSFLIAPALFVALLVSLIAAQAQARNHVGAVKNLSPVAVAAPIVTPTAVVPTPIVTPIPAVAPTPVPVTPSPVPVVTPAPAITPRPVPRPVVTPVPVIITPAPAPVVIPSPAPVITPSTSGLTVGGIISLTNQQRSQNGLPSLSENSKLDQAAAARAQDMINNNYFSHDSPDGLNYVAAAEGAGYKPWGFLAENIAVGSVGYFTDTVLMDAWMNSAGHKANILSASAEEIGVGVAIGTHQGQQTWFAVQVFGKMQ